MKILHTGDIHLDSPFTSTDAVSSEQKREDQRKLFCRIFETAKQENCDIILIAGDLFDARYITKATTDLALKLFSEAKCPIVISPGNHDPFVEGAFYSRADLPKNVYVFSSSELTYFDFEDLSLRVYGYAFTSSYVNQSPIVSAELNNNNMLHSVLCAHADISSPISRYAPITLGDIKSLGVDYAALGHIHNPPSAQRYGKTLIKYCGIPQGRSYDELGEGYVLIVDIDEENQVVVNPKRVSVISYELREIDVSECADVWEIRKKISEAVSSVCVTDSAVSLRIVLIGSAERDIVSEALLTIDDLKEGLRSLEIKDITLPCTDVSALEKDITLRGVFYKILYPRLISDDPDVRSQALMALKIGLAAIDGGKIPTQENDNEDT